MIISLLYKVKMKIIPSANTFLSLDEKLLTEGLLGIAGMNQSRERITLGDYDCWYIENLEPTHLGWTNEKIGVFKLNNSTPIASKIQGIWSYENKILFVANGNLYEIPDEGGDPVIVSGGAGIFDSSSLVLGEKNQGKIGTVAIKLYMCDGVSSLPRVYDGSSVSILTFPDSYGIPATVKIWRSRTLWTFRKDSSDRNKILFSAAENGDDYITSGLGATDAFYDECYPGDGDYIVGLGAIQFKGSDAQRDALVVCKTKQSFMGIDIALNAGVSTLTFNNNGVDIGAVSSRGILQHGNDLWILTKNGIKGFNAVLEGSGGISAFSSLSQRVDKLIIQSAENTAFENSFLLHHPEKQKVRAFLPKDASVSNKIGNITYPEIPNNYAICYGYGVFSKTPGNPNGEAYYTRGGDGFAFATGCIHNGKMILGDYFGNIYELDSSKCSSTGINGETITSQWETSLMMFGLGWELRKRIVEWTVHARGFGNLQLNCTISIGENRTPFKKKDVNVTMSSGMNSGDEIAVYNESLYNSAAVYQDVNNAFVKFRMQPPGWGYAFGLNFNFDSKINVNGELKNNILWLYAFSGKIEKGGN